VLTFISAVAVLLALGALGHFSSKRTGYTVLEPLSPAGRRLYRVLACLSMVLSAALLFALYRAYRASVEPGNFYITTDWRGYGAFAFILWLCLSGLTCFVATNFIMGGYVDSKPSGKRGYTLQQQAALAAARSAHKATGGNPLVPLYGFVIISLPCLMGIGLMQDRYVRPTERGLAHVGFFDVYEDVLPWEDIAGLSVVRVDDPDAGPYVRWNLTWTDAAGNEVMVLENRNIWRMMPHTINAAVAHHQARGIAVDDPRPTRDKYLPEPSE
jgi:hypothetical protein